MYKIYDIVCKEALKKMNGNRGKLCSQAGHAYLHSWWDAQKRFPEAAKAYQDSQHAKKITCVVETEKELEELLRAYYDVCGVAFIKDAGFTVFKEPTVTCLGIGPIHEDDIGDDLKSLKLLT